MICLNVSVDLSDEEGINKVYFLSLIILCKDNDLFLWQFYRRDDSALELQGDPKLVWD
jgi:hypothetical protein